MNRLGIGNGLRTSTALVGLFLVSSVACSSSEGPSQLSETNPGTPSASGGSASGSAAATGSPTNDAGSAQPSLPSCPNMPAGAKVVLETPFDTSDGEGQLWEVYPGAGHVISAADAPRSGPKVLTSVLSAGQTTGGQQTIWPKAATQQPLDNLYVCMTFKMNKDFVGIRTANKVFFVADQDFPSGHATVNGYFGLGNGGIYPPSSFELYFGHNTGGGLDNSHTCLLDHGLYCSANKTKTPIVPDTWYTVEAYVVSSKSMTSRDGIVKWWVNGTLNGSYSDMNYGDGVINEWQLNHTWDGSSAVQCGAPTNPANDKGRDCTKDQIYSFDHVILASVGAK